MCLVDDARHLLTGPRITHGDCHRKEWTPRVCVREAAGEVLHESEDGPEEPSGEAYGYPHDAALLPAAPPPSIESHRAR